MSYRQEYNKSIQQPVEFWREKAQDLHWFKFPEAISLKMKTKYTTGFLMGK